jgi:hypothetical protein
MSEAAKSRQFGGDSAAAAQHQRRQAPQLEAAKCNKMM